MKNILLTIVIVAAIYMVATIFKKKTVKKIADKFNEADAKKAILEISNRYGAELARVVEKMMRLETAHFKSKQYTQTGTAGMLVSKGWPKVVPQNETVTFKVKGVDYTYLVWNPYDFALFLANYIRKFDGNFARWNSLNVAEQEKYRKSVNAVKPLFV